MSYLEEIISLLEIHASHTMDLNVMAIHLQNRTASFFEEKKPLSEWKRVVVSEITAHADVLCLTPDRRVKFNPNRTTQLSFDFEAGEPPEIPQKKEDNSLFMGDLFS